MAMPRKQMITNLYITPKNIQRLANGYQVYKRANKHVHSLIPIQKAKDDAKAKIIAKKVAYHKRQLTKLIGKLPADGITSIKVKKPYTKRNMEFWNKGGNAGLVMNKKEGTNVQQGTL